MKVKRKYIAWIYVIAAGWFLAVSRSHGEVVDYTAQVKTQESRYQRPEDLIDKIPFLSEIPRTFLFGDGYTMRLSADQLRIDHIGQRSRSKGKNRACRLGVSYTTPVASFSTRIDLPLLHSPTLALSDWEASSMGDYVVYMSRLPAKSAATMLSFTARF